MNKMSKKLISLLVVGMIVTGLVSPVNAAEASTKEENIYGVLNLDGSIKDIYAVNIFNTGKFTDYGNYSSVRNLNSNDKLEQIQDQITVNSDTTKYYYQGHLKEKELPWNVQFDYYLDDKKIDGDKLAGQKGKLKIAGHVTQNKKVKSEYFNRYALQITLVLDSKLCKDIKAENATMADVGSKKQLTYTVLPKTGIDFEVTSDVTDFEMDAITINSIKLELDINFDDKQITDQIDELISAIKNLDGGANGLLTGAKDLKAGIEKYQTNLKVFNDGMNLLEKSGKQLLGGMREVQSSLKILTDQNVALNSGALQIQDSIYKSINEQLKALGLKIPMLTPENYVAVFAQLPPLPQLASMKAQLDELNQFVTGLKTYTNGVGDIYKATDALKGGTDVLQDATTKLNASSTLLYDATNAINKGVRKLCDGLIIYKGGTTTLSNETKDMKQKVTDKVKTITTEISGNDVPVISFVSEKNKNVSAVQFSMRTSAIKKDDKKEVLVEKKENKSIWQKFIDLFKF